MAPELVALYRQVLPEHRNENLGKSWQVSISKKIMSVLACLGSVRVGCLCVDALVVLHILERKVHQASGTSMVALKF